MTVTINEKQYDETKLDDASKIAIVRAQTAQNRINELNLQINEAKIVLNHYAKHLTDNVNADAEITDETPATNGEAPAEEAPATEESA
jgi:hypothetical protein|tara:strand:- start:91 stop:354 length:264 start_codon:yes stop_codon:yes gene_type:complete